MDRLLYIDILKGWSILCIVLLHFEDGIFPGWLNTWIGLFMISAFYFTSGWLAGIRPREITVKELAKKRWKTLGKPYLYFSAFILVFDLFLWAIGQYNLKFIAREVYKAITLRGIGTLWFLPALFGGEIIFRYLLNKRSMLIVSIALIITLAYLHYYIYWQENYRNQSEVYQLIDAPFYTIRNMLYAWPTIGIAYLISKLSIPILIKQKSLIVFCIGIGITIGSIYLNGGFSPISLGDFSPLITPVIGPLGLMLLAYPLTNGIFVRFLSFWGINSLVMMMTHYSITMVICQMIDNTTFHTTFTGVRTLVWFIVAVIATYPMVWFFNNKAKFMLGRK